MHAAPRLVHLRLIKQRQKSIQTFLSSDRHQYMQRQPICLPVLQTISDSQCITATGS